MTSTWWGVVKDLVFFLLGCALAGWLAFHLGYSKAESQWQSKINTTLTQAQKEKDELNQRYNIQLKEAIDERDQALSSLASTRDELGRVRQSAADYQRRLSRAPGTAGQSYRQTITRCVRLQQEGSELLQEARELLQRNAINHDALAKTIKAQ